MTVTDLTPILRRHPFCKDMPEASLALLAGCARNERFADRETLFQADTPADASYLIRAGRVALELHAGAQGALPLETAEEGELVGWSWLYPPYRWHFDAVAVGTVRAIRLDGSCLRAKCEADTAFGFDLTKRILYQAHQRLERSRMQALDVYGSTR